MHVFKKNSNIFELLTEAISEGILIVNEKQEIVASNTMTDTMFGYTKNELKGKPLHILIPETYRKVHKKHISKYQKNQSKRRMAFGRNLFGATKNGAEFPIEVGLNPFSLYGQNFVLALIMDVTERKRSELEIGHLAKILDESLNEIYIFDAESLYFSSANYGAQKNTGYDLAEFKQLSPLDLKPEFTESKFRALISPILENKRKKVVFETTQKRKNGTTYPVEVHMQSSTKGKKNTIVAIALDISDRKNYTQKLEKTVESRTIQLKKALAKERELNDLKTKFLSLVSHEFKTPLSGILISATLVGKYPHEDQQDKRDKHLKTIIGEVNQLNAILTDFLSIERLEAGKEVYKMVDFSLSKVINEVVYSANMLLKNGQHIRYPEKIDDVILHQDEKIISLCLTNLLYNAVKYSSEGSEIDFKVRLLKDKVVFHIVDQGIGIPEKDQKHIFDRYFRAENVLTTQGTGIGLNIVKGHVENLGGKVYFESKENIGSTFTMELPIIRHTEK